MTKIPGCECNGTIRNTGDKSGKIFGLLSSKLFMPLKAKDGSRNFIDLEAADLEAEILGKTNHVDPTKRIYPFHRLKTYTPEQADAEFATTDTNERVKLRDGIKTNTVEMWSRSNQFFGNVSDMCGAFGDFDIDDCGTLKGQLEGTKLYPRKINEKSYNTKFMEKTASEETKIIINFDYDRLTHDKNQWIVPASAFGETNPLYLDGLIDVKMTITPVTGLSYTLVAEMKNFGDALKLNPVIGLVTADVTALNDGTNVVTDVEADAVVDGKYTVTTSAVTTGDELKWKTFKPATEVEVNGFESETKTVVAL